MRLFTAVELPERVAEHLRCMQDLLRPAVRGVRWTSPANMHLTLKFLGQTPEDRVAGLCQALGEVAVAKMSLKVVSCLCFPPRGAVRIIGAGLGGDTGALGNLYARIEETVAPLGFARETRAYQPHITLARARDRLDGGVRRALNSMVAAVLPGPAFDVAGFALLESRLTSAGAEYVDVAKFI